MNYHNPVLLKECIEHLQIKPDGIYVDVTFGGGGHSREILKQLSTGHLYAFDQDPDAQQNQIESENFSLISSNFRFLKKSLRFHGIQKIDGLLADLGISSHQIDEPSRGFSLRYEGPLDMRMNPSKSLDAKTLVNTYPEEELTRIFKDYGELNKAYYLARTLVQKRAEKEIQTTEELKQALASFAPGHRSGKFWAQVFQAIRMEVNDEMGALHELLEQSCEILNPGGRLVFMSYHSLEDRPVKNFFKTGNIKGIQEKDFYGNLIRPLNPITRKPIIADSEELNSNPRARSAKLRVAEKIEKLKS
tara:strand:+ start:72374 stop:73285 length:912 start_codon:yes stop_codon:yes gene_type:complete